MANSDLPYPSSHPQPKLGLQGPVVGWQDPWAGEASDSIMRTGTGILLESQDGRPSPEVFLDLMKELGADFYVHHVMPDLSGQQQMLKDVQAAGLEIVLGNEYGNINGPFVPGTNRYDIPLDAVAEAAASGQLIGLLYDEPEHLQINADQYRKDAFLPHFGTTTGLGADAAAARIQDSIKTRIANVAELLDDRKVDTNVPMLGEQVFPVLFHTFAKAGMTPCPKVMKESFHPLQLSTALGAAKQYARDLWICVDLWGPDIGPWFTRAPGFPGHSPEEYASALRLAYYFAPSHMFTENLDVLACLDADGSFTRTEFGEVWEQFARDFVPANPLQWSHKEVRPETVLIHAEDSNFGRGVLPFGNPMAEAPPTSRSIFEAWHVLSHGTTPMHGSSMHIDGFDFPRARLNAIPRSQYPLPSGASEATEATRTHSLFQPMNNLLVFDEEVDSETLGDPGLIVVVGSRLPQPTLALVRARAAAGATVVIAEWLTDTDTSTTQRTGTGQWIVTEDFAGDERVAQAIAPHIGSAREWTQRFGSAELRITPADEHGITLAFDISR